MCCLITCTCLDKNILCGNYGSGANHHAWGFIVLQFPLISQSSPKTTFWLMNTPIQYKINWFYSRRLEMVGNKIPPYSWQRCAFFFTNRKHTGERGKQIFPVVMWKLYQPLGPTWTWQMTTDKPVLSCSSWTPESRLEGHPEEGYTSFADKELSAAANCRKEQASSESLGLCDKGGHGSKWGWSSWVLPSSRSSICLFREPPAPTVCSWVSSTPGGIMTERQIFPPAVNCAYPQTLQEPHPNLLVPQPRSLWTRKMVSWCPSCEWPF